MDPIDSKFSHSDSDLCKVLESTGEKNMAVRGKRKQPESEFTQALNNLSLDFKNTLTEWRKELDSRMSTISENVLNIKGDIAAITMVTSEIRNEISTIRSEQSRLTNKLTELDGKYDCLSNDLADVQSNVQLLSDEQTDLKTRIERKEHDTKTLIDDLMLKMDYLDQNARQCNLELCNVPERRHENLLSIMEKLGSKINFNINIKDIIAIHRVPHAHQESNKPKNIVVKLPSRILRDNFLSAYRLCKGLTSDQLDMSGAPSRIYVHEHITLKRKQLFRECKNVAALHNYKFVWVKHGTILVREKEQSKSFAIRSHQDLSKIKPGTAATRDDPITRDE